MVLLLGLLIINFISSDDGLFKVGSYSLFYVDGDSMEPIILDGDFIAVNVKKQERYYSGDIVSFYHYVDDSYIIVTHKIVAVDDQNELFRYETKGVNNVEVDEMLVNNDQIIGKYVGFRIPLLGYIVEFGRTNIGYLVLVVVPLGCILLFSIYELMKEFDKSKKGEK